MDGSDYDYPGDQNPFGDGMAETDPEFRAAFARMYLDEMLRPSLVMESTLKEQGLCLEPNNERQRMTDHTLELPATVV